MWYFRIVVVCEVSETENNICVVHVYVTKNKEKSQNEF